MTVRLNLRQLADQADPRKALLDSVGDTSNIEVFGNLIMVATYAGQTKSAGGILFADRHLDENRFQGKVCLVIAKGPLAFKDDAALGAKFGGRTVNVGDWVFVRFSNGMEFALVKQGTNEGTSCRIFEDIHVIARVDDPALIY